MDDPHAQSQGRSTEPELRHAMVDERYVARLEQEHQQLHPLLDRIDADDWQGDACDLIRLLSEHIGREESDLFPSAHQLLAPHQWDAVDAAVAAVAP